MDSPVPSEAAPATLPSPPSCRVILRPSLGLIASYEKAGEGIQAMPISLSEEVSDATQEGAQQIGGHDGLHGTSPARVPAASRFLGELDHDDGPHDGGGGAGHGEGPGSVELLGLHLDEGRRRDLDPCLLYTSDAADE